MANQSILKLVCAAGGEALEAVSLNAEESVSAPFKFAVEAVAESPDIDPNRFLSAPACVTLTTPSGFERHFHGVVRSLVALGPDNRGRWRYRIILAPKLWFATQTSDCRVFQNKTVIDIVKLLLKENGVEGASFKAKPGAPREYTVQYNETDYDFFVRLLEEEGYFWFFEHGADAHRLVIADSNTAFTDAQHPSMRVVPTGGEYDVLTRFERSSVTVFGKVKLADYDPLNPSTPVEGEQSTILSTNGKAARDVYRFPALTATADVASKRARLREEAVEAIANLFDGGGRNASLAPGKKIRIANDRLRGGAETTYVVRNIVHVVTDDTDSSGAGVDSYSNDFTAFQATTPWRDYPQERRPVMAGVHAAVVLGNQGEEIHTDKYGRIKVRFFWDHRKDATANDTIFIRVVQPWSGNSWGWQHLPRVGSEVAVAFVNGDPDSPIVVGSLYNAEQMPPFALTDQQTKTGLRTRSSLKGGTSDFTEWSIDDKKGAELVFFHAQKDYTQEVENDRKTHVMHDDALTVDNVRVHKVGKTEDITIGDAQTVTVGNGRTTTISQADDQLTVQQGDIKITASAGAITVTAMQSIELKVGSSSVKLDPAGVTVKGTLVKIEASAQLDMKGAMTNVNGDGMVVVKGGLVMIN